MQENSFNKKPILAIFDADFIPFVVCHNKKDTEEKTLIDCINMCDDYINNILKAVKADYYIGYLTQGKCFRYDINPTYKANRKYDNPPKFMFEIRDRLKTIGFIGKEGYEADDLCMSFKAQNSQYESIIISPDKDLLGICETSFNPRKMEFNYHTKEEIVENFWKSMIVGDRADNIIGIPGKGEAYFNKIIMLSDGKFIKNLSEKTIRDNIFNEYIKHFGEYEGIKEFTKNYLSLKILDNVKLDEVQLKEVNKINFCE